MSAFGEGGGSSSRAGRSCRVCRECEAPRERTPSPTESLSAQGRISRERHPQSPELLCPEISLIPCAKVSCYARAWWHYDIFFAIIIEEDENAYHHSSPKTKTFLAAQFRT